MSSPPLAIVGAYTALVTPFSDDGAKVDFSALEALVESQLSAGINGLVPCGTTGESPSLTDSEHASVVQKTVALAKGRVPVIAGAGANTTDKATRLAQAAVEAGADAVMVVMPYYNKPSQDGLFRHVTAVAKHVGSAPVVLYNVPARTVVDLSLDTLARIVESAPNVVAVKDATGNVLRCQQAVRMFGDSITVMCGDDALTLAMAACGARGVISVTSNVYPGHVADVCRATREGRWQEAQRRHFALLPVHESMFLEPSPGPIKAALAIKQKINESLRLPMTPVTQGLRQTIADRLAKYEATEPL